MANLSCAVSRMLLDIPAAGGSCCQVLLSGQLCDLLVSHAGTLPDAGHSVQH